MKKIKSFFAWLYQLIRPLPKEYVKLKPGYGDKLYELDTKTWDMSELDCKAKNLARKGCLYAAAINEKNAIKKFNKMVPGTLKK